LWRVAGALLVTHLRSLLPLAGRPPGRGGSGAGSLPQTLPLAQTLPAEGQVRDLAVPHRPERGPKRVAVQAAPPLPEPGLPGRRGRNVRGLFPEGSDRGALAAAGTLRTGRGGARGRVRPGRPAADRPGVASIPGPDLRRDCRRDGDEPEGGQ